MRDAVAELVRDGDTVAIEGFTHLICFAAGHEIIRQGRRDLTLARMTPDVIYDQMIGAGVATQADLQLDGQPRRRNLHAVRRRIEDADPAPLEIEEYSHFGMVCRYMAGAVEPAVLPDPQLLRVRHPEREPEDRADGVAVRRRRPGVRGAAAEARRRRSCTRSAPTPSGDAQIWGLLGCQKEAAFAAERVIVVVEEVVDESRDPPRPEPHGDPRHRRRRGRRGAVRVPSRPSRRATTTATTPSTWTWDRDRARPGDARRVAARSGCTAWRTTPSTWRSWAPRTGTRCGRGGAVRRGRLRAVRVSDGAPRRRGYSKSEMMIAASARQLAGVDELLRRRRPAEHRVQPRAAHGRAGAAARLRVRRVRRAAGAAAALDRRPDARHGRHGHHQHVRAVRVLPAGRADRRRVPGRRADRPVREPQHDGDRRLRAPEGAAARARAARARSRSTRSRSS